ncbi:MAG: aconitate hydratase AcnA, partial [Ilumatobacteraceae bacterium]
MGVFDTFGARELLTLGDGSLVAYYRLGALQDQGLTNLDRLPFTVRILLENQLRHAGGEFVDPNHVEALAKWSPSRVSNPDDEFELPFMPARVVLQDFTGVPCVVDLASMRAAVSRMGGDVKKINPLVPVDLVIDHSVQIDRFGTTVAFAQNVDLEYERNSERYTLLRWAQRSFENFRVVPPGTGIVHQVNLEFLSPVIAGQVQDGSPTVFPVSVVGPVCPTTMINGVGVLGWGVGGIEAEAVMLGQPLYQLEPDIVGVRLSGALPDGATATDLVLTITEMLRKHGVVGRFVEYFGKGLSNLPLADRATIANMAPEYGATAGLFPIDAETIRYLQLTGRSDAQVDLVERYCKAQNLFRTDATPDPQYNTVLDLDLGTVVPSVAGPRRPQDRVVLGEVRNTLRSSYPQVFGDKLDAYEVQTEETEGNDPKVAAQMATATLPRLTHVGDARVAQAASELLMHHGAVVIAAITSCTNTSNPSVMLGAGLVAKKAVERGLNVPRYVKTSLAPGSQVVNRYLERAGLLPHLEALGFHVVGYGCTTCIGNSGPLTPAVNQAVEDHQLIASAVLSGNRNFEGRIHPLVRAAFLASPPLVIAYALAGTMDIDLTKDPIGHDPNGDPVFLSDIWPTTAEVRATVEQALGPDLYREEYAEVFDGDERWQSLPVPTGDLAVWDKTSTYVQDPPFFQGLESGPSTVADITGARVLALLGDSVTTDHISPAGSIGKTSPAGTYLIDNGVKPYEFNSYGARRGNHEVMMRGTFANSRLKNLLTPGKEGNVTLHLPSGDEMTIYDASMRYQAAGTPLVVIGGKEYGTGSSHDWAAAGLTGWAAEALLQDCREANR